MHLGVKRANLAIRLLIGRDKILQHISDVTFVESVEVNSCLCLSRSLQEQLIRDVSMNERTDHT